MSTAEKSKGLLMVDGTPVAPSGSVILKHSNF